MNPIHFNPLQVSLAVGGLTAAAAGGTAILRGRDTAGVGLWILGGLSIIGCIAAGNVARVTSVTREAAAQIDGSLVAHQAAMTRLTILEQRQLAALERLGAMN